MKNDIRFHMRKSRLLSRIWNQMLSALFLRQWIVLIAPAIKDDLALWDNFTPIFPPADRFWADPFIWVYKNNYYVFVEELLYATNRGHIACLALDKQMRLISSCTALERPYHLSYPFLFEYEDQLYMLPETRANRSVEAYRCINFPNEWVFAKTLIPDVCAADTTLLNANGKWWLFTNISNSKEYRSDTLHLYYADQPLTSQWMPHPQNPIVTDSNFTRPAGQIFMRAGNRIRPSQDCSNHYGFAINFSRITCLTESNYQEVYEQTVKPPKKTKFRAAHTWNESKGLHVTDALIYWSKFGIKQIQTMNRQTEVAGSENG